MYKVLIIEDEANIRESICEILELENYDVIKAKNGKEGVSKAIKHEPDLILCDVMMPEMDGFETIKLIRENNSLVHTPFIFLTAMTQKQDKKKGMGLGADDYLIKPFKMDDLLDIVKNKIKRLNQINSSYKEKEKILLDIVKDQKKKVDFFAYTNAHKVRGPLARILGIINLLLLERSTDSPKDFHLINLMHESCTELDRIIRELSDKLYDAKAIT